MFITQGPSTASAMMASPESVEAAFTDVAAGRFLEGRGLHYPMRVDEPDRWDFRGFYMFRNDGLKKKKKKKIAVSVRGMMVAMSGLRFWSILTRFLLLQCAGETTPRLRR